MKAALIRACFICLSCLVPRAASLSLPPPNAHKTRTSAGFDFGTSGVTLTIVTRHGEGRKEDIYKSDAVLYEDSPYDDPSSNPNAWLGCMEELISKCRAKPSSVSISSTSNSLVLVDSNDWTPIEVRGAPVVAMYDDSYDDVLRRYSDPDCYAPDKLLVASQIEEARERILKGGQDRDRDELLVPFTPTGGTSKAISMLRLAHRLGLRDKRRVKIVPQSSFVLYGLMDRYGSPPSCGSGRDGAKDR